MKRIFALIMSVVMISLVFSSCGNTDAAPENSGNGESDSSANSGVLSEFTSTDLDGNRVDASVLKGKKLTMINIWATFCGPCINEMPDLGELNKEYADKGFQIIGIPIDVTDYAGNTDPSQVQLAREIIDETNADYLHIIPSPTLNNAKLNSVTSVPETIFVDENGNQIGESYIGSRSKEAWIAIIDGLLENM